MILAGSSQCLMTKFKQFLYYIYSQCVQTTLNQILYYIHLQQNYITHNGYIHTSVHQNELHIYLIINKAYYTIFSLKMTYFCLYINYNVKMN